MRTTPERPLYRAAIMFNDSFDHWAEDERHNILESADRNDIVKYMNNPDNYDQDISYKIIIYIPLYDFAV